MSTRFTLALAGLDGNTPITVAVSEQFKILAVGSAGPLGPPGPGIVVAEGPPDDAIGNHGDTWLDTTTGELYGPKEDGAWPSSPTGALLLPTQRYVYPQTVASAVWTIDHDLGGNPAVTVVDTAGSVVMGDVAYVDNTQVVVTFSAPFAGYAYLT